MSLIQILCRKLVDQRLLDMDWESDERIRVHRQILMEKRMIREVFHEIYDLCIKLDHCFFTGQGLQVEIGAGVSFFKEIYPEILSTDIKMSAHLDKVIDAQNMDFENETVRAIYGQNCFHHFPDPQKFFQELERVLVKGGGCVLIEPYYGPLAVNFYKNAFATETFDKTQTHWEKEIGVMKGANQALAYIVFMRDRRKFESLFPSLEIVHQHPINNYLRYLLSGGLNFNSLVPASFTFPIKCVEFVLKPVNWIFALHHSIVIRKRV